LQKGSQGNKKSITGNPKLDSKPWVPSSSSIEALAKSTKYLQTKLNRE